MTIHTLITRGSPFSAIAEPVILLERSSFMPRQEAIVSLENLGKIDIFFGIIIQRNVKLSKANAICSL